VREWSFHSSPAATAVLVLATHLLAPRLALADEPTPPPHEPRQALAEALFQEARDLVTQGKPELACPKFAESQRMDPATGTLLNLAACHESTGKLASAWSEFNEALAAAQRDGREDRVHFAKDHIHAMEGKVAHVTIRVPAKSVDRPLDVRLDGIPVGKAAWGTALPVDPGKHAVEAQTPGGRPWRREIVVDTETRAMIVDVPDASDGVGWGASDAEVRKRRTLVQIAGEVGAAGVLAGSVFGLYAFSRWHDAEAACPTGKGCSPTAINARASANASAIGADIALGVGIAGLAVATYVWATAPRSPATSGVHLQAVPVVGRAAMGMSMEGRF
jgi:hypothetical protein